MRQWVIGAILGFALVVGLVALLSRSDDAVENAAPAPAPEQANNQPSLPALETRPLPKRSTLPPGVLKKMPLHFPVVAPDAG